jgi:hypothetical protein
MAWPIKLCISRVLEEQLKEIVYERDALLANCTMVALDKFS